MTGILPFCLFIPENIRSSLFQNENKRESPFWAYLKNWTFDLEAVHGNIISAAPKDGFLLNALKHFLCYPEYFSISRNAF